MEPLIEKRRRLSEMEAQFSEDIRSPDWIGLDDRDKDSRGWELGNLRRDVQHEERKALRLERMP